MRTDGQTDATKLIIVFRDFAKVLNKTTFMVLSGKPYNENGYVKICTYNYGMVKHYTYLCTILTNNNE